MAETVLIADGDDETRMLLYRAVCGGGLRAETVSGGEEALEKLKHRPYALILLDTELPGVDGFEIVRQLRGRGVGTPVVMVSHRAADCDVLYALDIGADDFVTKPFNPVVLGAKVRALVRRSRGMLFGAESVITAGPFRYNTSTLRFYKNDREIVLSSKENAIMKLFMDNVNRIFSRDMIYNLIWGEALVDENAIMVYINRLRRKIEDEPGKPKFIQTVRGMGYRFVV